MLNKNNFIRLIIIIFLANTIFLLNSCNKNKTYKIKHIKNIKCVGLKMESGNFSNSIIKKTPKNSICYLNNNDNSINIYKLNNSLSEKEKIKKIKLNIKKEKNKRLFPAQFYIYSEDSIFYIDYNANTITLFDSSMNVKNNFQLSSKYIPAIFYDYNLLIDNNNIYYSASPDNGAGIKNKKIRINYYTNSKAVCKVNYKKGTNTITTSTFGNFPESYISTGKNYDNFYPYICIGSNQQIILSYSADHNIYVYKDSVSMIKKKCKSNYIKKFNDIPDDKFYDLSFYHKYTGEEPKYKKIIYDSYRNKYYRIVTHRLNLKNYDINKHNWSVIIMDDTFNVLGEVIINYSEYLPSIFLPKKEGIYLLKSPTNKEEAFGDIILSIIDFIP